MALKFLNKKGWHTGSLRNIENVWKAEQKHEAEQKKLDELRKQILEERERNEFRQLQEQAGLIPKQERLDFLYDSGLAVGKSSSDGFKALEAPPPAETTSSKSKASVPGALFEDKPQSANDTWRKLHSDPLLLIRQREQEALARIKNNPIQMAMIRKSVEEKKKYKDGNRGTKEHKKRHKNSKREKHSSKYLSDSEEATSGEEEERSKRSCKVGKHHKESKKSSGCQSDLEAATGKEEAERSGKPHEAFDHLKKSKHSSKAHLDFSGNRSKEEERSKKSLGDKRQHPASTYESESSHARTDKTTFRQTLHHRGHQAAPKLSAEEKASRAREMMLNAQLHEEQRWKRLKKASEADMQEANQASTSQSRNFLDAAKKSVYGTEGGSSTIEESVRRRTYYLQGKSDREGNAFRR